jgi:MFS-type transporter involved in bile tolerance (Atg22 family)
MQLCDTISAFPSLLAPIIGAFIIASFGGISIEGIRPLYYLQSLGLLLIFIFVYKSFRNPATQKVFTAPLRFIKGLRDVFGRGMAVKRWILFRSLSSIPLFVGAIYIPLYAAERKGADQFVLGAMATTSLLPPILLSVVMGKMADTIGRKKVIYFVTPFYCLSLILLIYASDQTMLLLSGILQGFLMLSYVTEGAMTAELVPVGLLGRWYGVLGLFRGMISVLAPVTAGIVWSIANPESVFIFLVVTQLLKMVILLRMPETLRT